MSRNGPKPPANKDNLSAPPTTNGRITVALVDKAATDLQATHDRTGLSKTDIVNRALSLYEFIDTEMNEGAEVVIRRDGKEFLIRLL
jgi:hypothetical protein